MRYRRILPPFIVLAFCMAFHWPSIALVARAAPRNIVLCVADDLSPDLGCYGNHVIKTPHLDRLARKATLYRYAFATTASCSASRSVILTGLHNHANGQFGHLHNYHHFSAQRWVQSLPVLLRRQGYRTARIGKYHVGPDEVFDFDEVIGQATGHPVRMAERCQDFIKEKPETPFFLYYATTEPHRSGAVATELPHRPNRFHNLPRGEEREGLPRVTYDPRKVVVPSFLPDTPTCRSEIAQYYEAVTRVDNGVGRLCEILKEAGHWDDTLILVTSDHGMAFAGAKTTVYEPGLRIPLLVRDPYQGLKETVVSEAMVSLLDVTPSLVDYAGGLDRETGMIQGLTKEKWQWVTTPEDEESDDSVETGHMEWVPYAFHGRSLLPTLGRQHTPGWDAVTASHTFHEIQMYYPMRVYRDRRYKLIWNIAYEMPYPFASDLWKSPTWQTQYRQGPDALYGHRTVSEVMRHPEFELFDMQEDAEEKRNLACDSDHADVLASYIEKLKTFQRDTGDPWILKWKYD